MPIRPDDICPRPQSLPPLPTQPHAPPIFPASVWECDSPEQADAMLGGQMAGYVYQRDSHPNADLLAEKCRQLHGAQRAIVTASGMAALSAALLSQLEAGQHAVVSSQLYGKTLVLFGSEASRLGMNVSVVDTSDLAAVEAAMTEQTKLLLVETLSNPLVQVADIAALANIAHRHDCRLLVDNTFASPIVCRPHELGADLVMESLTKAMNGHSDVILGLLTGKESIWSRVPGVVSAWGLASAPFECWLAGRGLLTAHLRIERACRNALAAAEFLRRRPEIDRVDYPGLTDHSQHELAKRQFAQSGPLAPRVEMSAPAANATRGASGPHFGETLFGTMLAFRLRGGRPAADAFIHAASRIPFCPSLGELSTTLSHPETTSHRGMTAQQREELGITGGTIRLSVGTESSEFICEALAQGLTAID
ncbi:MAG TPA: aminotransferase class I/II-fold pyridoxal phosphate-dependent enzyme [Pirellulaceae bacterium]|nr:aminotransferase class I/II-fold pyridoxal phosphate-dependent enzyme [Pirellulaceae bacterium]